MRTDIRTLALAALLALVFALVSLRSTGTNPPNAGTQVDSERLERALQQINQLNTDVDILRQKIRSRPANAINKNERLSSPSRVAEGGAVMLSSPWEHGQRQQRPDEKIECDEWIAGKRDTYFIDSAAKKLHVNSGGFTSQYKQDKQLWKTFFKGKTGLTYLDIAANHYKCISNTYFLDRCMGWNGICIEPNPVYHPGLLQNRSCTLVPSCISDKVEKVTFTFPEGFWEAQLGGISGGQFKNRRPTDTKFNDVELECVTVSQVLEKTGVNHVDFFSIDVEGHEKKVLSGIDWDKYTFDVILCESNCGNTLKANGYAKIAMPDMAGNDKVWLRKNGPYASMLPKIPLI